MENVQQGKVFVGGISVETSEETLTEHFCCYGEVVRSQVIRFRETGIGKGFGFVTFADSSVLHELLQRQHIILGRTVDVRLAKPKGENLQYQRCACQQNQGYGSDTSTSLGRKIFVGGLPPDLLEEDFKKYFESFGPTEDAKIIIDRATNTSRGFGFITYESEEAVTNVLQNRFYLLDNKQVEVKKADPREKRVRMNTYNNIYPTNSSYELWPIYDSPAIYPPRYWPNHTMVPSWTIPFNHLGTNASFAQPVPVFLPYFTPKHKSPVNCYGSMHNQVDDDRVSCNVSSTSSHEGNDQDCNNIEVQVVANCSPRASGSAVKAVEKAADNGEKDKLQVNTKAENGEKDQSVKDSKVNTGN
ncbi:hypothetical protein HAX54_015782 [Datura stramonium]|uniref:RRM domain-containing protein n=1 Tax=Datura stramonium TaxID=4076 RepID=A0ABS8UHW8_DATST|nr:hypothetical protein [Datura stramonium]